MKTTYMCRSCDDKNCEVTVDESDDIFDKMVPESCIFEYDEGDVLAFWVIKDD